MYEEVWRLVHEGLCAFAQILGAFGAKRECNDQGA